MEATVTKKSTLMLWKVKKAVKAKVQAALDAGIPAPDILNEGMISAMAEVGRLFEEGEYFVPEMLIAARAMQAGLALLKPHLVRF